MGEHHSGSRTPELRAKGNGGRSWDAPGVPLPINSGITDVGASGWNSPPVSHLPPLWQPVSLTHTSQCPSTPQCPPSPRATKLLPGVRSRGGGSAGRVSGAARPRLGGQQRRGGRNVPGPARPGPATIGAFQPGADLRPRECRHCHKELFQPPAPRAGYAPTAPPRPAAPAAPARGSCRAPPGPLVASPVSMTIAEPPLAMATLSILAGCAAHPGRPSFQIPPSPIPRPRLPCGAKSRGEQRRRYSAPPV